MGVGLGGSSGVRTAAKGGYVLPLPRRTLSGVRVVPLVPSVTGVVGSGIGGTPDHPLGWLRQHVGPPTGPSSLVGVQPHPEPPRPLAMAYYDPDQGRSTTRSPKGWHEPWFGGGYNLLDSNPASGASTGLFRGLQFLHGRGDPHDSAHVGHNGGNPHDAFIVLPFFGDSFMPVEGRVGVAVHF